MSTLHRVNMLRIKQCSDSMLWYRHLVGQLVPHLGFSAGDGFRSREPAGYVNFVLPQDAEPTHVHVGPDVLGHWPFNCQQDPLLRRLTHAESIARRLLSCSPACHRTGKCQSLPTCKWPAATRDDIAPKVPARPGQSRAHSAIETATNIAVGFVVSMGLTAVVLPAYGHEVTAAQNVGMTSIFTVASVLRSYGLRRLFNRWHHKGAHA